MTVKPCLEFFVPATVPCACAVSVVVFASLLTSCSTTSLWPLSSSVAPESLNSAIESSARQSMQREFADWALTPMSAQNAPAALPVVLDAGNAGAVLSPLHAPLITVALVDVGIDAFLYTIARQAELDLLMHEPLSGRVTLSSKQKPVRQVLSLAALQVPFHWKIENGGLHVWGNSPFSKSYPVNYLNLDRATRSRVGLATQVGTINANGQNGSTGASNSSETLVENHADHVFWSSLATDLDGFVAAPGVNGRASYTINRDVGLATLHAPVGLHRIFEDYLAAWSDSAQRQVLIEATVVEVALSENFSAGVDWQVLSGGANGVNAVQALSGLPSVSRESAPRITSPNGLFSLVQSFGNGSLGATVNLLEQFGDVRILSKPRIIALNNQSSVLKVVDNRVYFTVNVERQRSESKDEIITETEIHTVPVGLVMHVTPHISAHGDVMLNVRPTLSRILGFVDDPNPELAAASVKNSVPEIQVREMESMLRVRSGELAIIGGLMQDTAEKNRQQLPGLASLPWIGQAFKQKNRNRRQTELLIVLRPTVMPDVQQQRVSDHG